MSTICSFCQSVIETEINSIQTDQEKSSCQLVKTLYQAANIDFNSNSDNENIICPCQRCTEILTRISICYGQLQQELLKIKSIILNRNCYNRNRNVIADSSKYNQDGHYKLTNALIQDFNPSVRLDRVASECVTVKIKKEEFNDDWTDCGEGYFEEIITPETGVALVVVEGQSFHNEGSNSSTQFPSDETKYLPLSSPTSPSSCRPRPKRRKGRKSTKQKKRVETPNDEADEDKDLRLIPCINGEYNFMGFTLTPVNPEQTKHYTNKWQRNRYGKFKCGKCSRIVRGLYNLKCHVKEVHLGMERYGCKTVKVQGKRIKLDSIRNQEGNMVLHGVEVVMTSDEKKYSCGSCSVSYKTRFELFTHIRHVHAKIPKPPPKKKYGPQTETLTYRTKSEILEDGRQMFSGVEIRKCGSEDNQRFQCGSCNRTWKTKGNVMAHIKIHHPRITPYACSECGAAFAYKHLLEKHQVQHENEKPFVCDRCGKLCKRKGALLEHTKRIHLNVINFTCPHCQKGFFGKKDFRLHLKRHEKGN